LTTKQAKKREKKHPENVHVGQLTLIPVSSIVASEGPPIVRKSLRIKKDGVFGKDTGFGCSESDKQDGNMGNATVIACSRKASDRWTLHA
jgi:hypothetical protein